MERIPTKQVQRDLEAQLTPYILVTEEHTHKPQRNIHARRSGTYTQVTEEHTCKTEENTTKTIAMLWTRNRRDRKS